ncbi:uncharacterized protein G6M90_00g041160 [Metarhizium brunneum]|uniref:DUF6594 domain-containing protein n=1 Tax=Metarhizium brunneum TaxID=500148 RepID=A0A7D5Z599_9HYPO|nr:hypothetical protein G6M90_00g041160 [Metarhizium brunneum]
MADDGKMETVKDAELFDYSLHRLNIIRIQNDLIVTREHISHTRRENLEKEKFSKLLDEYSEASNYDYVHEARLSIMKSLSEGNNASKFKFPVTTIHHHTRPFESHYYYLHDNAKHAAVDALCNKLRHWISPQLSYSSQERLYRSKEFGDAKPTDEISTLVDNLVRLLVALVAVLVVVIPMFIVLVHSLPKKSLIPSSVFMIMFACVLSFMVKTSNVETLVTAATYLAILVVFVRANSLAG